MSPERWSACRSPRPSISILEDESPPQWSPEQLERDRLIAIDSFKTERLQEPLDQYVELFDKYQDIVEELLETTIDLTQIDQDKALEILCHPRSAEAFRYLAGPIISEDDLKTLTGARLSPKRLRADPAMVDAIVSTIRASLDRRRFAWVSEHREPDEDERRAAVVASAALIANSRAGALRRNEGKTRQERAVRERLEELGLKLIPRRKMPGIREAPAPGELCLENKLGGYKADLIVGLWDGRILAIECKVSNSAVNSVKRLNHEAASKAEKWKRDLGEKQVVPAAVLSGVYDLANLLDAQARGLTLFWAHRLDDLTDWVGATRSSS